MVDVADGAAITEVRPGTPAADAGLRAATGRRRSTARRCRGAATSSSRSTGTTSRPRRRSRARSTRSSPATRSRSRCSGAASARPSRSPPARAALVGLHRHVSPGPRERPPPRRYSRVVGKGWESVRLDEIEPIPVVEGKLLWRPVRRTLDIGAFGINSYVALRPATTSSRSTRSGPRPRGGLPRPLRRDLHARRQSARRPRGTLVFLRDPAVKRHARAEEPGTTVLAVGGPRGRAYEPSPWEICSRPSGTARPATTRRWRPRSRPAWSSTRTTPPCSTTSPARRPSRAGRRTRSSTSGERSSLAGVGGPHPRGRRPRALRDLPDWSL